MSMGLLGRKVGMTRVFKDGGSIPVTVVYIEKNRVTQIKSKDGKDGYTAVQLTAGSKKASHVNKPLTGHFAKAEVMAGDMISEFIVDSIENYSLGQAFGVADLFQEDQFVDVSGISKGKGFAGTVKRHNFRTQDASHGNSVSHRAPGSIGQNQTPGRVFKGKKMAGHLGNGNCTAQNLQIVRVDQERNLLLIKGAIPGFPGARVKITAAVKKKSEVK